MRARGAVRLALRSVLAGALCGWLAVLPITPQIRLSATTALIMGGTLHPLVDPAGGTTVNGGFPLTQPAGVVDRYVSSAVDLFIATTAAARGVAAGEYRAVATYTPAEFWPIFGLRSFSQSVAVGAANLLECLNAGAGCVGYAYTPDADLPGRDYVVYGYSQSAAVATAVERTLTAQLRNTDGSWSPMLDADDKPVTVSFVLTGNPNRPNGGVLQRFYGAEIPLLGVSFDGSTPTDSCDADGIVCRFPAADISWQYDGWSDFPVRPLNVLADLNALAGIWFMHYNYSTPVTDAMIQGVRGDTTYYLLPARRLPLLMPLEWFGVPSPILTALDAPLRVIVEWAYDRDIHPGEPTTVTAVPRVDPITALTQLAAAIPVGLDDGFAEAGFGRPLGTVPAGLFGVPAPAAGSSTAAAPAAGRPVAARVRESAGVKPGARRAERATASAGRTARPAAASLTRRNHGRG